jgi:hypothetical protein
LLDRRVQPSAIPKMAGKAIALLAFRSINSSLPVRRDPIDGLDLHRQGPASPALRLEQSRNLVNLEA